jgi:hypothetical protein
MCNHESKPHAFDLDQAGNGAADGVLAHPRARRRIESLQLAFNSARHFVGLGAIRDI